MLFNSSVGIEITARQVKIVYLKGSFTGMDLAAVSGLTIDPGKSRQDRQTDIISFINGFIREKKVSAADIFIGISGENAILREIEFPLAVKENLRATLAYEIEKYIPVSIDDVYFDYHITAERKEEEKFNILLVAVKKGIFQEYLDIAAGIGPGVSGIGIIPAALTNYYIYHQKPPQGSVLLFYAGDFGGEAVVLKDQSMVYAKTIAGSDALGDDAGEKDAFPVEELTRLRDVFCPEGAAMGLAVYGLPASSALFSRLSNEFQNITAGIAHADQNPEPFIPAFGIALCGMVKTAVDINLMPVNLRKKPDKTGIYIMTALLALLILAGGIWTGSHLLNQRRIIHDLDAELTRLRSEVSEIEQIQSQTLEMQKNMEYIHSLRPGNAFAMEILNALSMMIPSDAWLTDLKLTGDKLQLYGVAASATGLISLLEQSPLFENVEFISTIRKDREGREMFRIGCTLQAEKQGA